MSLFGKYDRNFGTNRKLRRCGSTPLERATTQLVLLQLDAEHLADLNDGLVSASRAHPEQLAISLASFGFEPEQCEAALASLQAVGIIERYDDGSVQLVKWKEWSTRALSDTERKKRSRGNLRPDDAPDRDKPDTESAGPDESRPVTECHDESRSVTKCPGSKASQASQASQAKQAKLAKQSTSRPVTGRDVPGAPPPEPPDGSPPALDLAGCRDGAPPIDGTDRAIGIMTVLEHANFERGPRRWRWANELAIKGMEPGDALGLWKLAQAKGDDPAKLFAHWLRENLWRSVLDEDASLRKERGLRKRTRKVQHAEDPL